MATNQITPTATEGNPITATINYIAADGTHIAGTASLSAVVEDIAWSLEEKAEGMAEGKIALMEAATAIRALMPDTEAMPPEPDPVAEARTLLWKESQRAQELLRTEAERQRKEAASREAFAIPFFLLAKIIDTAHSAGEDEKAVYEAVEAVLEDEGWLLAKHSCGTAQARRQEPLRQLATLLEYYSGHHLTAHALQVVHHSLRWCENTSTTYLSPISGRANGEAPEGVQYPHIEMTMHPFTCWRDIPKEWTASLVENPQPTTAEV